MWWLALCVVLVLVVAVYLFHALIYGGDEARKGLAVAAVAALVLYLVIRAGVLPADLTNWLHPSEGSVRLETVP